MGSATVLTGSLGATLWKHNKGPSFSAEWRRLKILFLLFPWIGVRIDTTQGTTNYRSGEFV